MKKLINGIIDFRQKSIIEYRNKFAKLALQQSPDTLFVACCDSRVVPNIFASTDPGDLFVLRNIGNLVPPYQENCSINTSVSSAVEFALDSLNVSDIIVCGHSECGAMYDLLKKHTKPHEAKNSHLTKWLGYADSSYERFSRVNIDDNNEQISPCNLLSRINVLQQLDNLKTHPLVVDRLQNNRLRIHGWWFDLAKADVYYYNNSKEKFNLIDAEEAANIFQSEL